MFNNDFYNNFMTPQQEQITTVNGYNGANSLRLAPNSSKLALDVSGDILWCITTDSAGYKTIKPQKLSDMEMPLSPEYKSLEDRLTKIEEQLGGLIHELTGRNSENAGK